MCETDFAELRTFLKTSRRLLQLEKNSFVETSETTERPRCVESGLDMTDATAPAASRRSPQSAAPREGVMEFAAM
jgi:hypothetical protein